ncbi:peptidase C45 [Bremerella cremea]|uniref:Peptidase C45 n=1 Tax=Bremerella cremea TaxID=1031537 RepID=A0A368KTY0_9BACT|nr:carcinine hydrolase/isopenicillin-N N-acyltransferase family protein [Bremerella cremea]RCS53883.1 peptidase C45 [Bremerella cremea]
MTSRFHWRYAFTQLTLLLVCTSTITTELYACTTAVISGKVTADGRPLLWKNRDTSSNLHNEVAVIEGGKFQAVAVVNAGERKTVWMGVNEAGFCIENSLSKDLAIKGGASGPGNGTIMRMALQTCKTVADFQKLLEETNQTGRSTVANYGVIDAHGGAGLFETGPKTFKFFDANDPQVAPNGYIVRSNFATTARKIGANPKPEQLEEIYSSDRFLCACRTLESCRSDELISLQEVVRNCARDLSDDSGVPYPGSVNGSPGSLPEILSTKNTISRTTTVSAAVFHGVKPGEDPKLTTMWTMLGDPKFSIAVPTFPIGSVQDDLTDEKGGEIGEIAISLRDWNMTADKESIVTTSLPDIWQDVWPVEDLLLDRTLAAKQRWATEGVSLKEVKNLQEKAAEAAMQAMEKELLEAKEAALAQPAPLAPQF